MSDLAACMDALGVALATIPGLRAHPYEADTVTPPAAIVAWPDTYEFDTVMQRGADRMVMPVLVVVGRADARTSRDRLAKYVAGDGAQSVKAAIEAYQTPAWYSARVQTVDFDAVTIGGKSYLAATFNIELLVPGKG